MGVKLSGLAAATAETERDRGLSHAIDRVRGKFGATSLRPAGLGD
ncbi:MAG: hypothetical protein Q8Q14_13365 [Gemmatimonadales bacterium]|nr:hypothetical protein [Gemmatimonadales bacterium]